MSKQILNQIHIKKATKNDIKPILEIAKQVSKMIKTRRAKFFGRLKEFRQSKEHYLKALASQEQTIFVATTGNNKVVGYIYLTIEKKPDDLIAIPFVDISEIIVDSKYRKLGVGTSLMNKAYEWTKEKQMTAIQLSVWEFNKEAFNFYEKLGYKTIMRKMELVLPLGNRSREKKVNSSSPEFRTPSPASSVRTFSNRHRQLGNGANDFISQLAEGVRTPRFAQNLAFTFGKSGIRSRVEIC
ncbi:GNAT family N-acetyltransferase [candidate division WWE3 bacterium]|nr:GNAT family N-acetyltransferase [candidate division WWE3 bacterium]